MCRYALKDYKSHFACFDCRKMFKKAPLVDWAKQNGLERAYTKLINAPHGHLLKKAEQAVGITFEELRDRYLNDVATCPDCGSQMAPMGWDFRPPKRSKTEEWQIIELLYNNGFAFQGCGCYVGYSPPSKLRELPEFFKRHERLTEGEALLAKISSRQK